MIDLRNGDCIEIMKAMADLGSCFGARDCSSEYAGVTPFVPHMARLAKTYQIRDVVRFCGRVEISKGLHVVNRDAVTNESAAHDACTLVALDGQLPGFEPSSPTVRRWPADPARRFFTVKHPGCSKTFARAKARVAILSNKPWLDVKRHGAVLAMELITQRPFGVIAPGNLLASEGVSRLHSSPEFVAHKARAAHYAVRHMPLAATNPATEGVWVSVVWLRKCEAALLAFFCDCFHSIDPNCGQMLTGFMGSGSTGKGAALGGFSFIGIELDPAYVEISRARIAHVVTGEVDPVAIKPVAVISTIKPKPCANDNLDLFEAAA